jgi:hypothetical protein
MDTVTQIEQRATRLEAHVEAIREEVASLRKDIEHLKGATPGPVPPGNGDIDCFGVALALAQDLGGGVSSENPHGLSERGDSWFEKP